MCDGPVENRVRIMGCKSVEVLGAPEEEGNEIQFPFLDRETRLNSPEELNLAMLNSTSFRVQIFGTLFRGQFSASFPAECRRFNFPQISLKSKNAGKIKSLPYVKKGFRKHFTASAVLGIKSPCLISSSRC